MNVRPLIREWRPKAAIPLSTNFAETQMVCIHQTGQIEA
jgi:hypothetical protein